jgi:hypothetical protein
MKLQQACIKNNEALQEGEEAHGLLQRKEGRQETSRPNHDRRHLRWRSRAFQVGPHHLRTQHANGTDKRSFADHQTEGQTVGQPIQRP